MILRNRKRQRDYHKRGHEWVEMRLFKPVPIQPIITDADSFLMALLQHAPSDMSKRKKDDLRWSLQRILSQQQEVIEKIADDSELIRHLQAAIQPIEPVDHQEDPYALSHFIKSLALHLMSAPLNRVFPGLVILFTQVAPTVAHSIDIQVKSGHPDGGENLCAGVIMGCLEGYLKGNGQTWSQPLPQFSRQLSDLDDQASSAAYLQMKNCLDINKMGENVKAAFLSYQGEPTSCTVQSMRWHGVQVAAEATGLTKENCAQFQKQFDADAHQCMSNLGEFKFTSYLFGGIVGGFAILTAMMGMAYYLHKKCRKQSHSVFQV